MKIVILGDAPSPHIKRWSEYFISKQYEVHIISFRSINLKSVKIHHIHPPKFLIISQVTKLWRKLGYLFSINKIRKLIISINPDILHAHWATSYGLLGALSNFHPFIISVWGRDIIDSPTNNWLLKKIIEYSLSKADAITATSKMLKKETEKYIDTNRKVFYVPFGIDLKKFKKNTYMEKDNSICIGIVKSLEHKYGIKYLIKAFARLKLEFHDITLLIVGGGSLYNELVLLVKKLNIKNDVNFVGEIDNDDVTDYLHKMDIFVVPSISESETFGVSAVEASACCLPVIASNIGGLPEVVIDGETGLLVEPENIDDLFNKLKKMINSREMRIKLGVYGRKFIKSKYGIDYCGKEMEKIYNEIR